MSAPVDTALITELTEAAARDGITKIVVGAVIPDADGNVLLLHRTADDYLGGLWELPSGSIEAAETLIDALHREVEEETGLKVTAVGDYLGHFDYLSKSGKKTRQFNFAATAAGETVKLTEHDAHEWADHTGQEKTSSAVQNVLEARRERPA
ncbi:NUDIX hydrolase [Streptomyces sp. 8N616]|uniref:NUDIX hydrolase n=1 Tax=Streptomyces sp. 8N616 TaxID=3457414 RepID=UPI003FD3D04C